MQKENLIKQHYVNLYKNHYQKADQTYLDGEDSERVVLQEYDLEVDRCPEVLNDIPQSVKSASEYYFDAVEGWTRICKIPFNSNFHYAICVSTDGDDGWIEIYDNCGQLLIVGRTYLELIAWGTLNDIREYTKTLEYPSELNDRHFKTLWK